MVSACNWVLLTAFTIGWAEPPTDRTRQTARNNKYSLRRASSAAPTKTAPGAAALFTIGWSTIISVRSRWSRIWASGGAQVGYAMSGKNEIGLWAAWRDYGRTQDYFTSELPITYEPIGQVNLFWHHKISAEGADTWLWMGVPAQTRINQAFSGVLTDFTFGASVQSPMSDSLALAGTFQYAKAAASQGVLGSLEDSFDLSVSLVFYPGRCAKSKTVAGRAWMPLLPVANNGSFMVDRNL